ncbi:recombination mediator RecR [Riemerella columbipharyngis]|uniref:Recombination protein RecR n=1 Tax=Riemerella columbipharyngis TaxID=1071918 RepID=A0A1G7AV12_9FLAO|nr:recombination mediator RecR [Riemerella columbipharyngis]SDE18643.1 DNA replication and repair protein RecR [Riemerella columbipharyngis]
MKFPSKVLENVVDEISGLPGIGRKSAIRLALHILKQPERQGLALGEAIKHLVTDIKYCKECHNFSDADICDICADESRNTKLLCVVEDVRDVIAIENTGKYKGRYLVLGGVISPMEGIGPHQLNIASLEEKLNTREIEELIFALPATMEGDTTAYYLYKKFKHLPIAFTNIARGISVGDELEYADEISLGRSIINRIPYKES